MQNFTDEVIARLGGAAKAAPKFAVTTQAVCDWLKRGRIPAARWDRITELLPDVTIQRCYVEFERKTSKPNSTRNKRH